MADARVKVFVFVDDLRLLSHKMENGKEIFALRYELLGLFEEFRVVGVFIFELFIKLLFLFEFIGKILNTSHNFVIYFREGILELLIGFMVFVMG